MDLQSPMTQSQKNDQATLPRIVLASGSPRRRELLGSLGLPFEVILPQVDEKAIDVAGLSPKEVALKLAIAKGEAVSQQISEALVIASDTIVVIDKDILGKPEDPEDAFAMLSRLQGTRHSVLSAIAVFYQGQMQVDVFETTVFMRPLTPNQIWQYIETQEPMDKAGSYAIQGIGSLLVQRIEGCYFNVVGMSLVLLDRLCQAVGVRLVL